MKKANSLNSYLLEKCVIGNGIINGIINAVIFYFMEKGHPDEIFNTSDIVIDLAITSFILGIILVLIVLPLTKKDVESGKLSLVHEENKIANFVPDNTKKAAFVVGLVDMVIITVISFLSVVLFKLAPLTVTGMMIFKGIMCAIAGMIAGYMCIAKVVYQKDNSANNDTKIA